MLWVLIRSACEALLMSTHNICFYGEIRKISQNYHPTHLLNKSSDSCITVKGLLQNIYFNTFYFANQNAQNIQWRSQSFPNTVTTVITQTLKCPFKQDMSRVARKSLFEFSVEYFSLQARPFSKATCLVLWLTFPLRPPLSELYRF